MWPHLVKSTMPVAFPVTRGQGAGAVEGLGIVGARQELCATFGMYLRACACDRSFWSVTVNDVLIANQDCHRRAANEPQVCRFRETPRVSLYRSDPVAAHAEVQRVRTNKEDL